jgi:hypothetical protein|nr:hypothetical protein [Kofleriaceae bacterium]
MLKHLVAFAIVATPAIASANIPNSVGIGVETQINGTGGIAVNYDAGKFDAGGFFGILDPAGPDNTEYAIGGRFFYHVHQTANADFGVGGSIGLDSVPVDANNRNNNVFLEPGFQIRMFVVPNVALSFAGGIVIGVADADGVSIGGQIEGLAGVTYFFN